MRFLHGLLITLTLITIRAEARDPSVIGPILQRSIFAGETAPANLTPGAKYQPMVISVMASLKSREPERTSRHWRKIFLPPTQASVCKGKFKAYFRGGHVLNRYAFVILPGSYATFERGSFTNQTAAILDEAFDVPTQISFSGYLSPDFLSDTCRGIPWDTDALALDFYTRLRALLIGIGATPEKTGIIGFSGGGLLTLAMMAHDAQFADQGRPRLFGLGAMAFSPILDARTTFQNLDEQHRASQIDPTLGLTTLDWSNLWAILTHLGPPGWQQIPSLYAQNPTAFLNRAFNEFTVVDLAATLNAVGAAPLSEKNLSYYNVYAKQGFQQQVVVPNHILNRAFDFTTDLGKLVKKIDRPTLIYFSKDDPVLSNANSFAQPEAVTQVLNEAQANPAMIVFNPKYGAHTGALLDPIFPELIQRFFLAQ